MTIIRISIATVALIPHGIASGIHAVAPKLRSRYTVHGVAVSLMYVGFHMGHTEHAAVEWVGEHAGRILKGLAEFGWEPVGELLKGIGLAPYLDGAVQRTIKAIEPEGEKK